MYLFSLFNLQSSQEEKVERKRERKKEREKQHTRPLTYILAATTTTVSKPTTPNRRHLPSPSVLSNQFSRSTRKTTAYCIHILSTSPNHPPSRDFDTLSGYLANAALVVITKLWRTLPTVFFFPSSFCFSQFTLAG